ncbi:MAG: hypothetical protein NDJ75_02550 [Thermoanaerobaculia bacterium]|nr:hypothetical protein [Thermoanaerobaculia bacterium]
MYVVRNVFRAKPGQAVHLVAMFQRFTAALPPDLGLGPSRILTDASAGFWTVVVEDEVADLAAYLHTVERMGRLEAAKHLEGYHELVESGYREILRVEPGIAEE